MATFTVSSIITVLSDLSRRVGFKFAAVTVQLSAFNGYTMNLCGSGSPGAGLTAKGAGEINSTPSETHTRRATALVCQCARVFVYGTGRFG
jgi:hypothetical protein